MAFIKYKTSFDMHTGMVSPLSDFNDSGSRSHTNFAWNVGTGVGWKMTDWLTLDLSYRFAHLGKVKSTSLSDNYGFGAGGSVAGVAPTKIEDV